MDTIGQRIRHARQRLKMRQQDLAEAVGVYVTTVRNWELGHTHPGRSLARVERVLNIDLHSDPNADGPLLREASVPVILAELQTRWDGVERQGRQEQAPPARPEVNPGRLFLAPPLDGALGDGWAALDKATDHPDDTDPRGDGPAGGDQ